MKKLYLITSSLLILYITSEAQYKINKSKYDYNTYKHQAGDPYRPGIAGFTSFLIPGLGQMSTGSGERGAAFLGAFIGCITIYAIGNSHYYVDEEGEHGGPALLYLGFFGAMAVDLIAVIDAVRVAKVTNLYFRDKYKTSYKVQLSPCLVPLHNERVSSGLSLKVKF